MPVFKYRAKRGPREVVTGKITALSQEEAIKHLEEQGVVPIKIWQDSQENLLEEKKLDGKPLAQGKDKKSLDTEKLRYCRVKREEVDIFIRQLASLLRANVSVVKALALIKEQSLRLTIKLMVSNLLQWVKEGMLLSQAMARYPYLFNTFTISMVHCGEKAGVLSAVLSRLAFYRAREAELKQKIQSAIAYPIFILAAGIVSVAIILIFFFPKVVSLFDSMHQQLPFATKLLIMISKAVTLGWYWVLIILFFIVAVISRNFYGKNKKKTSLLASISLRIPFLKKFIKEAEIARFTRAVALLLKNGIGVYEGLLLAGASVENSYLQEKLHRVSNLILSQGLSLSESIRREKIFPDFVVNMIVVGEEGGSLEESLTEVADFYEQELIYTMKIIVALLEPILILGVGLIIAFIVFAMLLPIFNMGTMY